MDIRTFLRRQKIKIAVVFLGGVLLFSFQNFTIGTGSWYDSGQSTLGAATSVVVGKDVHYNCIPLVLRSTRSQKAQTIKHRTNTFHCINTKGDYFLTQIKTFAATNGGIFEKLLTTTAIVRPSVKSNTTLSTIASNTWIRSGTTQNKPILACPTWGCNKPNLYFGTGRVAFKIPGINYGKK